MECPHEWEIGAYVDEGLAPGARRRLEAHLVACERCRRGVLGLREEAQVLSRVLQGVPFSPAAAPIARAPARGAFFDLPLSIAAAALIWVVGGVLFNFQFSAALDWLHPARFFDFADLLSRLVFLLRDESQGLLEWAVGVGAIAALAGMATFLSGAALRRLSAFALLFTPALLFFAAPEAHAALDYRHGEVVHVTADERVEASLVVSAQRVMLDGVVAGDAIIWARHIEVRGVVEGNLVVAGQKLSVSGEVAGAVISATDEALFNGAQVRSALVACGELHMDEDARTLRDMTVAARLVELRGVVGRDLTVAAGDFRLSGTVERDLLLASEHANILHGAEINGAVQAHTHESSIEISPGAVLPPIHPHWEEEVEDHWGAGFYAWRLVWLVGAFGVGLLLHLLLPGMFQSRLESGAQFGRRLLIGLASFPLTLTATLVLLLTVVGIPLAILLGLSWAAAVYLAHIVASALLGRAVTRIEGEGMRDFGLALVAGLLLVTVLVNLPWVGFPARLVLTCVGLGALFESARAAWLQHRRPAAIAL